MATLKRIVVGYRGSTPYFLTTNKRWSRYRKNAIELPNDFLADRWAAMAPKNVDCKILVWATNSLHGAR